MFAFLTRVCILITTVRGLLVLICLAGCAELGVVTDGSSISVGKPSGGHLVDGVRLPDRGEGFFTRDVWKSRNNRYGTDELIDLITGVSRRLAPKYDGIRLVVADLSGRRGGEAHLWHRSHQSGRDVDLVYPVRDKDGKAIEPDAMRVFLPNLVAKDGSGLTIDVPRTWLLVKEIITAPEAPVQWVFMYEPIAQAVLAYAQKLGESEVVLARARRALKQPGDSAPHNDHIHVRIYCSIQDRVYGCLDIGPLDLLAEREAEMASRGREVAGAIPHPTPAPPVATTTVTATIDPPPTYAPPLASATPTADLATLQRLLRSGAYRGDLWRFR